MSEIVMRPIGFVKNEVEEKKDVAWGSNVSVVELQENYYGGLEGLEDFSHVIILYYLDKAEYLKEKHLKRRPQNRDDMPLRGIFSQRGKDRPNKIGMTSVEIVSVTEKNLTVKGLDAIDGTAVLDIKPYYPVYDKKDASVPEWVNRLMEHYF
ncbi:MAG: tRNA (N6-threonylcarbamoyladenosine(37)-N6)-methyltransferase TrmO [Treponema sp.]|uniref:tRNA (N6-threonylcarbamoyladenosine(37)-N6)-methyltransferase TrmO n=1 Tax=Treponema sp. TaxID=166 RepID=UPI00298D7CD0|nr:tRNA (N6-threonylcarbamoyladenosine(37)-N6)-methyltransferase TrmO [Treponema sp.]MCR5387306.1 tRNA (N6-threonylcarbamoyladenosine(37)-N6)-methyltransferase TrmO [Treponema sp.]